MFRQRSSSRETRASRIAPANILIGALLALSSGTVVADDQEFSPQQIEFFEKHVRPLLVERCHKCHAVDEPKGGLRLDTRAALLQGGDTGPAIVPGRPDESELIRAIRYEPDGYQMPPDSKLPDEVIAKLTEWVAMGAPWPAAPESGAAAPDGSAEAFDLEQRAEHWSFQPLARPAIPSVQNSEWCRTPVDRFLLAKMEAEGITPAAETDSRTWLRRVSFDVIGLPPTPDEVDAFVNDRSPDAYDRVIERLLASPHYGERWGRHWLDLVRYAESRGHEFDHDVANPWHYRDYVIRALNDDVPYDQFVVEHVAGDLLQSEPRPSGSGRSEPGVLATGPVADAHGSDSRLRLHPQTDANESILATGFWFLGEWVHSPVDIRQDEADRFENMLDVYSKTFLGLTVACARCHDHKFDPIRQKDYYALQGYLQSSIYRQVRYETMEHNRRVAAELEEVRREAAEELMPLIAELIEPVVDDLDEYLIAARELIRSGVETYPLQQDIVFADFESGTYDGWNVDYDAFGTQPTKVEGTPASKNASTSSAGNFIASSSRPDDGGRGDEHIGVLTSKPFVIDRSFIKLNVSGGSHEWRTCVLLLVEDDVAHAATGRNDDVMRPVTWDVRAHRGKTARIRVIDNEKGPWGRISVDEIVLTDHAGGNVPELTAASFTPGSFERIAERACDLRLDAEILGHWIGHLLTAQHDESDPFYLWAADATGKLSDISEVHREAQRLYDRNGSIYSTYSREALISSHTKTPEPTHYWEYRDLKRLGSLPQDEVVFREPPFLTDGWWEFDRRLPAPEVTAETVAEPGATASFPPGVRLRTSTFDVESGKLYCLVRGSVNTYCAVDSHILVRGPLHGTLVQHHAAPEVNRWRWIELDLSRYTGHRAHIEFTPRPGEDFALAAVIQSAEPPPAVPDSAPVALSTLRLATWADEFTSDRGLVRRLQENFKPAHVTFGGYSGPPEYLMMSLEFGYPLRWHQQWATQHPHLLVAKQQFDDRTPAEVMGDLVSFTDALSNSFRAVSAVAPAMLDGTGEDEYVFIRGNWKKRGEVVPRRFLEVFGGERMPRPKQGSGRLELARWMVDPAKTPILPRVVVNRIWQHYFGRGIVPTPDDFGHMGLPPSHPELLDWLASELVDSGWSLKHVHRLILNSAAYRMASAAEGGEGRAESKGESQISNLKSQIFAQMQVKRLEGEIIRDAMLTLSGRLDDRLYGRSVPVHLTPFMEGRGRPEQSGPVDGAGRRSLYIAVRRNFAEPFFKPY
ncbi:MAG: PSD1 and planctomycete cytochrome C domain-containing protein [Planctomycetaceae bacterium]